MTKYNIRTAPYNHEQLDTFVNSSKIERVSEEIFFANVRPGCDEHRDYRIGDERIYLTSYGVGDYISIHTDNIKTNKSTDLFLRRKPIA